jgi:GWxTD domain-containing protein
MRKKAVLILAALLAANFISARELTANLTSAAFGTPDGSPYVETYLSIIGNSVRYVKNQNGRYQAAVDIRMSVMKGDSLKDYRKYVLNSPETDDTTKAPNFLDLQRFSLPIGLYDLTITMFDVNRAPQRVITNGRSLIVDIDPDSVGLSHIQMLESYKASSQQNVLTKSGYDLVPYVASLYPGNMANLSFYGEVYNTKKVLNDQKFLVLYYIEGAETHVRMSDYNSFQKMTAAPVNSILYSFDISKLPTGTYNLVVEVRNAQNRLLSMRTVAFERFNPGQLIKLNDIASINVENTFAARITSMDTLTDYIRSLGPISTQNEKEFAETRIEEGDLKLMQQYFFNFWQTRNESMPEAAWISYNKEVQKVNRNYGTQIMKGYQTDRGRVYLQYGPPDQIVPMINEPSSYPYEVWQYYTIRGSATDVDINSPGNTTQTNKKFVFANFDLVTNNYVLIHSDARGEVRDDRWKVRLTKRDNANPNLDDGSQPNQYGGRSSDVFDNPH